MSGPITRVAITGAAGYVASRLIHHLEREAYLERILAIDVRPLPHRWTSKVVFFQRDVSAPLAELLSEHGIEAVVHLAFILNPGHDRAASERVNLGGIANVLDACARAQVRHFLYLSSTSVYGAHPDNPSLLTEASPVRPIKGFQYSEDKARSEALLAEFTRSHPTCTATVLRACPVMGPNADNFIARALSRTFLVGVTGCDPALQFLHEDDLCNVMRLCLLRPASATYNVAGDGAVPWSEMAKMLDRRLITLPAPLLHTLTGLAWTLRLQSDSPACGLNFIKYPWTVSTERIRRELDMRFRYSSRDAWAAFAQRQRHRAPPTTEARH